MVHLVVLEVCVCARLATLVLIAVTVLQATTRQLMDPATVCCIVSNCKCLRIIMLYLWQLRVVACEGSM